MNYLKDQKAHESSDEESLNDTKRTFKVQPRRSSETEPTSIPFKVKLLDQSS